MEFPMRRLAPRLLACACLLAGASQAQAALQAPGPGSTTLALHPYGVEDLLDRQALGPVTLSPGGRWLAIQSTAPYRAIVRFDLSYRSDQTISRLDIVDLKQQGPPRRLFADTEGYGYLSGPYSPSGDKMTVTRVRGHAMELGIVDLATGKAIWSGLTPTANLFGRTVQWRDDGQLVAIVGDPMTLSFTPVYDWQVRARLRDKWRVNDEGGVSLVRSGSGRYLGQHDAPAPRSLVIIQAATGRAKLLAQAGFFDLQISPGGAQVALLDAAEDIQPDPAAPAGSSEPYRRHRLSIVDLTDGARWSPCPTCEYSAGLLAWSRSGASLLAYGKLDAQAWSAARYWRIAPGSRQAAPLETPGLTSVPDAGAAGLRLPRGQWMGETPLIFARPTAAGAASDPASQGGWYGLGLDGPIAMGQGAPADADRLLAVGPDSLWLGDGRGVWRVGRDGDARPAGQADRALPADDPASGERLMVNDRPAITGLAVSAPRADGGARLVQIGEGADTAESIDLPPDETTLAATARPMIAATLRRDAQGVETVRLRTPGSSRNLLTLNAGLASVSLARPQPIRHWGIDDQGRPVTLTSWLYLPPGLPPGGRAPLVVIPYPGQILPDAVEGLGSPGHELYPNPQILAAAGYAVLKPSLPVDTAREPMEGTAERILKVVDAVAASGAPIDTGRVALWGHSYGGYAVLAAATQSPRFKAIIAAAASPDLFTAYGGSNLLARLTPEAGASTANAMGWLETGQARMGAPPWRAPQRYVRNSPILQADKITAPVLLITSDFDGEPVGPRAMFNVLYRQGKDAIILDYLGEAHQMVGTGNIRDLYARALSFLADQLDGSSPCRAGSPSVGANP
jgi:dipeptidyl aminopeptidase/acylaminoacyl peptidase